MTIDLAGVLRDAWALWKRDADLLVRVAGLLMFVPALALLLLVPPMPPMPAQAGDEAGTLAWMDALSAWVGAHGHWYLLAYAVAYWGQATLFALYVAPGRPDVRGALTLSAVRLPRYWLAMVLVSLPVGAGFLLLIVPGLYVLGRLLLAGPSLIGRPSSATGAMARSLALTRGQGLAMMGLVGVVVLGAWLVEQPILVLDDWLRANGADNPVAMAIVDVAAAIVSTLGEVALVLVAVVAYRRRASTGT